MSDATCKKHCLSCLASLKFAAFLPTNIFPIFYLYLPPCLLEKFYTNALIGILQLLNFFRFSLILIRGDSNAIATNTNSLLVISNNKWMRCSLWVAFKSVSTNAQRLSNLWRHGRQKLYLRFGQLTWHSDSILISTLFRNILALTRLWIRLIEIVENLKLVCKERPCNWTWLRHIYK